MKKLISVLLSVLMIFSALSVCFTASAYSDYSTGISDLPCIYIQGQGSNIITEDGEVVYGSGDPGDSFDLMGAVQECLPYLKDALLTNDWTPYQQKLLEIADAIYGKVPLTVTATLSTAHTSEILHGFLISIRTELLQAANMPFVHITSILTGVLIRLKQQPCFTSIFRM